MKNKNTPILSICIPTYNNAEKVYGDIKKILSAKGNFEVILSSNGSTDNTLELLQSIDDPRLIVNSNENNLGPFRNCWKAISLSNSKYSMLFLDKDHIDMRYIDKILKYLDENDFSAGYFQLDETRDIFNSTKFKSKFDCLHNLAYLCKHPTGYIVNNEKLKLTNILNNLDSLKNIEAFSMDLVNAELAILGDGAIIDVPFCSYVMPKSNKNIQSTTYSSQKNNLYFTPENRFKTLEIFVKHLNTLNISYIDRFRMLKILLKRNLYLGFEEYIRIYNNKDMMDWYNLSADTIEYKTYGDLAEYFLGQLKQTDMFINPIEKMYYINMITKRLNKRLQRRIENNTNQIVFDTIKV